jgi:hypothetical protein
MQISQIYISDSDAKLPEYFLMCIAEAKKLYPDFEHVLYNKDSLRKLIADHFDQTVLSAYDKLKPYSYKADLGKYCLLYALGGMYIDISIKLIHRIPFLDKINALSFRDIQHNSRTSWACSPALIYSKPNNPVFQTAIDLVVTNCKNNYYGINSLCPTGPVVLGQAFAIHGANATHIFGDLLLTPDSDDSPVAFFTPDRTKVALLKPFGHGGDLSAFGAKGTNNYGQLWGERNIFNESLD